MPSRYGPEYATVEQLDEWRARLTGKVVQYRPHWGTPIIGIVERIVPWDEWHYEIVGRERSEHAETDNRLVLVLRESDHPVDSYWLRPDEITVWGEGRHA